MPREVVRNELEHDRGRSIGWAAVWWIETFCVHGPGDVQGEPVVLDDEFVEIIVDCYAVDENGRRLYDSVFISRAKGRAKSELAGFITLWEAFGNCRFERWATGGETWTFRGETYVYEPGEPIGRAVVNPVIRCLATEEGQAGNTYDNVHFNLTSGPLSIGLPKDTAGLTRVVLPHGGKIIPSTASSASKDGGKETFAVYDEPMALDTKIPTPDGWKHIGDLVAGDYVFGVDGKPVLVYGVAPVKHDRPCFRVTFDDGDSVVTDGRHRWLAFDRKSKHKWVEISTQEMHDANWYGGKRFAVAQPEALELPEKDLPLDPYAFGLWLGDGDARASTLTVGAEDMAAIVAELERLGFATTVYEPENRAACVRFNHGAHYGKAGTSQHALRELGVLGSKHVPDAYLWASREQRLALLQGLMDSDGYVNDRGNCIFTNTSRVLADAVVHLVRSLGWRTSAGNWASDERWGAREAGTWRVSFTPSGDVPFRLKRKADRCRTEPAQRTRAIEHIEPVESVPVRCIAVDSDDHLFLAGDSMLPTHNTHLYVLPELKQMYRTVRRNLSKRKAAEPWSLETSTMYAPGEDSVAEESHKLARLIREGKTRKQRMFFDHRHAAPDTNLADVEELTAALREVYGPFADVMDLSRIVDEVLDPRNPPSDSRRYFLNCETSAEDAWLTEPEVAGAVAAGVSLAPADRDMIGLGFDGSKGSSRPDVVADSTALIATRLRDGFQWPIGIWEQPPGVAGRGWAPPELEIEAALVEAHERFDVVGFFGDPSGWTEKMATWTARWGAGYRVKMTGDQPIRWKTNQHTRWAETLKAYHESITNGRTPIDGTHAFVKHLLNARRRATRSGLTITKRDPDSADKIDGAIAGTYSFAVYIAAIAAGVLNAPEESWVPVRVR